MKKIYLFFLGMLLAMLPCKAQTLQEGKVWNFVQKMYETDMERAYTVTVSGDTIANGQSCKKLVEVYQDTNEKRIFAVFEKDSKIYGIFGSETKLFMDYNLKVGDKADELWTVASVDYINVNNKQRKRITLTCDKYNFPRYIVEGIGLNSTQYNANTLNSYYKVLVSVYENGICIFKDTDFAKQTTGIYNKPKIEKNSNPSLYDLSGRQVFVPQKGQIYIQGKKKIVQ